MSTKDQRTEKATAHKRLEERRKGRLFRGRDIIVAGVFLFEIVFLKWNIGAGFNLFQGFYQHLMNRPVTRDFSILYVQELGSATALLLAKILGPLLILILLFSFSGQLAQGGWNFSFEPIQFNFSKMMPKNNFSRIFSSTGLFDLLKSALLFALIGLLGWTTLVQLWPNLPSWVYLKPQDNVAKTLGVAYDLAWNIGLCYAVIAVLEYFIQKRQFEEGMKMTKQEIKDEFKQLEGNPQIKGKIRQMQLRMSRRRMVKEVSTANVVVTNPTHYAIALRYDAKTMQAPEVVAKGRGWQALKIRKIAQEHGVPLVENKSLAQLLYKKVEVGESIPVELYRAVAEVLAYLMRAREAFSH